METAWPSPQRVPLLPCPLPVPRALLGKSSSWLLPMSVKVYVFLSLLIQAVIQFGLCCSRKCQQHRLSAVMVGREMVERYRRVASILSKLMPWNYHEKEQLGVQGKQTLLRKGLPWSCRLLSLNVLVLGLGFPCLLSHHPHSHRLALAACV